MENHQRTLTLLGFLIFSSKAGESLCSYGKCQKIEVRGDWTEFRPKICFLRQFRSKCLEQSSKTNQCSKTGQN